VKMAANILQKRGYTIVSLTFSTDPPAGMAGERHLDTAMFHGGLIPAVSQKAISIRRRVWKIRLNLS